MLWPRSSPRHPVYATTKSVELRLVKVCTMWVRTWQRYTAWLRGYTGRAATLLQPRSPCPLCFVPRRLNAGGLEEASGCGEQVRGRRSDDHVVEWRGGLFVSSLPSSP